MKVLHWAPSQFLSDPNQHGEIKNQVIHQRELGHAVRIFGLDSNADPGSISRIDFEQLDLWGIGAKGFLSQGSDHTGVLTDSVLELITEFIPDLIQAHDVEPHDLLLLESLLESLKIPLVTTFHRVPPVERSQGEKLITAADAISDQLVAASASLRDELVEAFPLLKNRILQIPNGISAGDPSQRGSTLSYEELYAQLPGMPTGFHYLETDLVKTQTGLSVFERDLATVLMHRDSLPRLVNIISSSPKPLVLKLTNDTTDPLPAEITENAFVFRTSMLARANYRNEYSMPALIHGLEFDNWKPVGKVAKPTVGFVGQYSTNVYHKAIVSGGEAEVAAVGLQKTSENVSSLRSPINIGLMLRKRVINRLEANDAIQTDFTTRDFYHYTLPEAANKSKRRADFLQNLNQNAYSVCVRGAGNFSIRLYETLAAGRIPIILDSSMVFPLDTLIPWRELGPWVEITDIDRVDEILLEFHDNISPDDFKNRQRLNREIWQRYLTKVGFWTHALKDLELK